MESGPDSMSVSLIESPGNAVTSEYGADAYQHSTQLRTPSMFP